MRCEPARGASFFLGGGCAYTGTQIWLCEEVVATKCADVVIASLFARRRSGIPFTFCPRSTSTKETVAILHNFGWSDEEIRAAAATCPTQLPDIR